MSIQVDNALFVRVEEDKRMPASYPLESGFSLNKAYRVLGMFVPSESGEAWVILSNDCDEIWFITNRQLRTYGTYEQHRDKFRIDIP